MQRVATASRPETALEAMWTSGLTEREIVQLIWLKQDVLAGKRSEITAEYKRYVFARYRYERGLLHD